MRMVKINLAHTLQHGNRTADSVSKKCELTNKVYENAYRKIMNWWLDIMGNTETIAEARIGLLFIIG